MKKDEISRATQLLELASATKNPSRAVSIARQVLEIIPDNTEALIIIADNIDDNEERISLLQRALDTLDEGENCDPDDREIFRATLNERLAYAYFGENRLDDALSVCRAALDAMSVLDDEETEQDEADIKALFYRILIGLGEWKTILSETLKDEIHGLSWAYSRLIAAWMVNSGESMAVCANMFWDALMISPDVPFYMLGYYEEPGDNSDIQEQEDFDFAFMYYDILSVSEEFKQWFTRGTILFGLLTNRFDGREREYVLDVLDTFGGYEEYEKMSSIIVEGDDEAVIELLAASKCLSE